MLHATAQARVSLRLTHQSLRNLARRKGSGSAMLSYRPLRCCAASRVAFRGGCDDGGRAVEPSVCALRLCVLALTRLACHGTEALGLAS